MFQANTRAHRALRLANRAAQVNSPTRVMPTRMSFVYRANTPSPQVQASASLVLQATRRRWVRARARNVRLAPSRQAQARQRAQLVLVI